MRRIIAKDPVCGMDVAERTAAATSTYQGQTYCFCSVGCKTSFDEDPVKFVGGEAFPVAPRGGERTHRIDASYVQREYRRLARFYDLLAVPRLTARQRREAVARLALRSGDCVLDLGCGTGLSLSALVEAVGPAGRVVGVDLSEDQLARSGEKVAAAGWENVSLTWSNAEELQFGEQFDGILASYTHDIMTSAVAVARAVAHLKPGGRFVALGFKRPTGWRAPLNAIIVAFYWLFRVPINWDADASRRPWADLEHVLGPLEVEERFLGTWYRAVGVKPPSPQADAGGRPGTERGVGAP